MLFDRYDIFLVLRTARVKSLSIATPTFYLVRGLENADWPLSSIKRL